MMQKDKWYIMNYINKNCPICGNEFIVLNTAAEKAVYCTLKCLSDSQDKINEHIFSFLENQCNPIS